MKKTLKQIINAGRSIAAAGVLAFLSGCMSYHPISEYKHSKSGDFYSEIGWRGAVELPVISPKLSKEQKYVPIHPADGGAERGGSNLSITPALEMFDTRFGLEGSTGFKRFRVKAGANLSYLVPLNSGDVKDGYPKQNDQGNSLASIKLQPLPWPYESYAYGQFRKLSELETEPFVGIEFFPGSELGISLEIGKPSSTFRYEKGHWRWDSFEQTQNEKWKGRGTRYLIRTDFYDKKRDKYEKDWGLFAAYEKYDTEFSGVKTPVNSYIAGIVLSLD